jgi:flagellar hook assembly protein FlgD
VFNALGQKVQTLVNQKQNTGNYKVNWNGKDNSGKIVSSGVYFYTLKAGNFTSTRKMILLR